MVAPITASLHDVVVEIVEIQYVKIEFLIIEQLQEVITFGILLRNPTLALLLVVKQTDDPCVVKHLIWFHTHCILVVGQATDDDGAIIGILHLPFLVIGVFPFIDHEAIVYLPILQCKHIVGVAGALDDIDAIGNDLLGIGFGCDSGFGVCCIGSGFG